MKHAVAGMLAENYHSGLVERIKGEDFAYRAGITGVPCFIANGQYAISGAQEPEGLFPLFDLARQKEPAASDS